MVNKKGDTFVGAVELGPYYFIDSKALIVVIIWSFIIQTDYEAPAVASQVLSTIGLFPCLGVHHNMGGTRPCIYPLKDTPLRVTPSGFEATKWHFHT